MWRKPSDLSEVTLAAAAAALALGSEAAHAAHE
jgi:hypothetical protein